MSDWNFPFWIAHRGAGKLAPENTLAAFRVGAAHGYKAFECDVKLSSDGVLFLLHDATLNRTTNGTGVAGNQTWHRLSLLDAGSWHSRQHAGEVIPTLEAVARFCQRNAYSLNIEIKPTPGCDAATGQAVARACAQLWAGRSDAPLLTSFQHAALESAQAEAPELPRGLLMDQMRSGWVEQALSLRCQAVTFNYALWDESTVRQAHSAGFKALSYTVNDEWAVARLRALGTDGIITDRLDLFSPN